MIYKKDRCNYLHKKGNCKNIVKDKKLFCSYHKNKEIIYYHEPSFIYNIPNVNDIPYPYFLFK